MYKYLIISFFLFSCTTALEKPSFSEFESKANNKEPLSVVFFGGSLTWGANASDPNRTCYRGYMMEYLQKKYPETPFKFHDAAIGGTGSDLGLFRMERDVLSHKPDLVFLDFTVNDDMEGVSREALATYESILRQLLHKQIPIVQVILSCGYHFKEDYSSQAMVRRTDHLKLGKHYSLAIADTYPVMYEKLKTGKVTVPGIWPFEQTHPDDKGYRVFFEVVKKSFEEAVSNKLECKLPEEKLYSEIYNHFERKKLVDTDLPDGWNRAKTYRTSMWYDGLSSRWIDDVAMFDVKDKEKVKPLTFTFKGSMIGLMGESNHEGLTFMIKIDGEIFPNVDIRTNKTSDIWRWDTSRFGKGSLFRWLCISKSLSSKEHTLEIIPIVEEACKKGQLRIESICVARQ